MSEELLDIFNENMKLEGIAARSRIHELGLWHQTFQCWFIYKKDSKKYIIFQKRNSRKQTFPDYFDITSAGHLAAGETPLDGTREIEEELGIKIDPRDLIPAGIHKQELSGKTFLDREFCHVYLFDSAVPIEQFSPQLDEVSGIYAAELELFQKLVQGSVNEIILEGYGLNSGGIKIYNSITVGPDRFVPHGNDYYEHVIKIAKDMR